MICKKIEILTREALQALGIEADEIKFERPRERTHGDYATSVALIYGKKNSMSPRVLAGNLVEKILETPAEDIEKIEIAGAGFINFFLTDEAIQSENKKAHHPIETVYAGKKVLVEHSSPNLFKPFHIGHLMNNIVGEFIVRAITIGGGNVTTISFPSDVSLGIAKAVYVLLEDRKQGKDAFVLPDEEKIGALGEAYRRGVTYFDEHPDEVAKAKEIARIIYDTAHPSEIRAFFERAKELNNAYLMRTIKDIGSVIEVTIYESEAGARGKEIVVEHTGDGKIFTKSEGAIVYIPDPARKDLHTQVFINSEGHPTYEAKDLGLIDLKFSKFAPDLSYFITDAEQIPHFKVVLDAAGKLGGAWVARVGKSFHIPHGRMLFRGQKMSSRLGGVPLALETIAAVEEEVRERAGDRTLHLSDIAKRDLERDIALAALRIAVLRSKPGININFDPDESLSFEGDSGPYLLYTHARCASLLEKGKEHKYEPIFNKEISSTTLERELAQYEFELTHAVEELAPQRLVTYLFGVAQLFNTLYGNTQFITDDRETSEHYLAIIRRTKAVLKEGLWVLGIPAPERM